MHEGTVSMIDSVFRRACEGITIMISAGRRLSRGGTRKMRGREKLGEGRWQWTRMKHLLEPMRLDRIQRSWWESLVFWSFGGVKPPLPCLRE